MQDTQETLRKKVLKRCTPQKVAAKEIGLTNIYFNKWLKGHKILSEKTVARVQNWLNEE